MSPEDIEIEFEKWFNKIDPSYIDVCLFENKSWEDLKFFMFNAFKEGYKLSDS